MIYEQMIVERVKNLLVRSLGADETQITNDSRLIEDLGADSLDVVDLVEEAQAEFDIEIQDEDIENMKTFGDVVACIIRLSNPEEATEMAEGVVGVATSSNVANGDEVLYSVETTNEEKDCKDVAHIETSENILSESIEKALGSDEEMLNKEAEQRQVTGEFISYEYRATDHTL